MVQNELLAVDVQTMYIPLLMGLNLKNMIILMPVHNLKTLFWI